MPSRAPGRDRDIRRHLDIGPILHGVGTVTLTEDNDGGTCSIAPGDRLCVELDENPTTGYLWAIDSDTRGVLRSEGSTFSLQGDGAAGAGGRRALHFVAAEVGEADLRLKLWRELAGDSSIVRRFAATVNVRDPWKSTGR
jgi:inhibitor of cysteine peptidase